MEPGSHIEHRHTILNDFVIPQEKPPGKHEIAKVYGGGFVLR